LASELSPITVKDGHIATAKSFFRWAKRMKKLPVNPPAEVEVVISDKHVTEMRRLTGRATGTTPCDRL
jgi:hypothetical protein